VRFGSIDPNITRGAWWLESWYVASVCGVRGCELKIETLQNEYVYRIQHGQNPEACIRVSARMDLFFTELELTEWVRSVHEYEDRDRMVA
jgi:hypothetical protein